MRWTVIVLPRQGLEIVLKREILLSSDESEPFRKMVLNHGSAKTS